MRDCSRQSRRLLLNAALGKVEAALLGTKSEAHLLARLPPLADRRSIQTTEAAALIERLTISKGSRRRGTQDLGANRGGFDPLGGP